MLAESYMEDALFELSRPSSIAVMHDQPKQQADISDGVNYGETARNDQGVSQSYCVCRVERFKARIVKHEALHWLQDYL